jgi:SAM-dependent methyltransferase
VLGQSQPRISRHLRVLTEAGLLDRFREQQCVYYRAPVSGRSLAWLRQVLAMADPETTALMQDRERAARVVRRRAAAAAQQLKLPQSEGLGPREELAAVLRQELGPASIGKMLDIGTGSGLMIEILGPHAEHAIGVDISVPALRLARARVHGAGLSHCEFRREDMYGLSWEDRAFDIVTMDRVLATAERPLEAIEEAARLLRPTGRLVLVEDFESLAARAADNPLSMLRRWLACGGFETARLRPCDLAARHVVVALAQLPADSGTAVRDALRRPDQIVVSSERTGLL